MTPLNCTEPIILKCCSRYFMNVLNVTVICQTDLHAHTQKCLYTKHAHVKENKWDGGTCKCCIGWLWICIQKENEGEKAKESQDFNCGFLWKLWQLLGRHSNPRWLLAAVTFLTEALSTSGLWGRTVTPSVSFNDRDLGAKYKSGLYQNWFIWTFAVHTVFLCLFQITGVCVVCVYLCRSSSRFSDVCVSLFLLLKGGCISTLLGSAPSFCCSERRHAAMTTAGVSSHWSGYSPPSPRRCGCSSSKVDNRFLDLTEKKKTF